MFAILVFRVTWEEVYFNLQLTISTFLDNILLG